MKPSKARRKAKRQAEREATETRARRMREIDAPRRRIEAEIANRNKN